MMTVSWTFLIENEVNRLFLVLFINGIYNKDLKRYTKKDATKELQLGIYGNQV